MSLTPVYWTITDMLDYACKIYPSVNYNCNTIAEYKDTCRQQIKRFFDAYEIPLRNRKHALPEPFAKFLIETYFCDYFTKDENEESLERKRQRLQSEKKERKEKTIKAMERKLNFIDESLNDERDLLLEIQYYETIAGDPEYDKDNTAQDTANELKAKSSYYYQLSNGEYVFKSDLEYHIYFTDNYDDFLDKTIDRVMLRAIFDGLYDFNEKDFRQDFYERQQHIMVDSSSSVDYLPGYSSLTYKLEHPMGNYIFPKNKKNGNRK